MKRTIKEAKLLKLNCDKSEALLNLNLLARLHKTIEFVGSYNQYYKDNSDTVQPPIIS